MPSSNRDEEDRVHQWNELPRLAYADADVDADADTHYDHPAGQHGHAWGMPSNRDHKITFASTSTSASHTNEGGRMNNDHPAASAPGPYSFNQARSNHDDLDFGVDPLDAARPAAATVGPDNDRGHDNKDKSKNKTKNRMSMYHPNPNSDPELASSDPSASASAHGPRSASAPPLPMTVQSARVVAGGGGVSRAQDYARGHGQP
jgi:hypothetical protein